MCRLASLGLALCLIAGAGCTNDRELAPADSRPADAPITDPDAGRSDGESPVLDGQSPTSDGPVTTVDGSTDGPLTPADSSVDGSVTWPEMDSLFVTPRNSSIAASGTQAFTATATFVDNTTMDVTDFVTWTSSDSDIATISGPGLATGVNTGAATITAEVCGIVGNTVLTVMSVDPLVVTTFPSTHTFSPGATVHLMAVITMWTAGPIFDQDITYQASWSSSEPSVATVDVGLVTAVGVGSATISASLSWLQGTTTITVTNATVESISVLPLTQSIAKGEKVTFTAEGSYSDGSKHDVSSLVDWQSSPGTVLMFKRNVATGSSMGTATVTASHGGVTSNPATVQVGAALLTGIEIEPESVQHLALGDTIVFSATGTYSDGTTQDISSQVTWSASPAGVLTLAGSTATAVATGTAVVGATLDGVSSKNTTLVYVTPYGFRCGP